MWQKPKHILTYAQNFCKGIRLTQARNFAALCWAIFRKRTTVLSELARCFVRPRRHIHRLKRIWRFVSNLRFNFQAVMDAICLHNLAMVLWASGRRVVLVDITFLTDDLAVLAAALACRGRAVPICLWAFERKNLLRSQNTLTHQLLAHLKSLIGDFVLVADRGFGHCWTIRCCRQLGIDFVLRIRDDVHIHAAGTKALAKQFLPQHKGKLFYPNALYHGTEKLKVNLVAVRKEDAQWLLVTSLTDFPWAIALYRQRMQIEQTFRDLKSLLGLSRIRVRGVRRLQVLLVAMMAVYSFLFWCGVLLARCRQARELAASGSRKLSFPSLAVILFDTYPLLLPRVVRRLKEVIKTG